MKFVIGVSMLSVTCVLPEYMKVPILHTSLLKVCRQTESTPNASISIDTHSNIENPNVVCGAMIYMLDTLASSSSLSLLYNTPWSGLKLVRRFPPLD